jgi:serine/threonine protein kinase
MLESQDTEVENWMADAVLDELRRLAPSSDRKDPMTVQDYYKPDETFLFKLVNRQGKLTPIPLPPRDVDPGAYSSPKALISDLAAEWNGLPLVDASCIEVLPMSGNEDFVAADPPRRVMVDGQVFHFKGVQDPQSFRREFGILQKLKHLGLNKMLRVPTLHAAVRYADEAEYMVGFLLEQIDSKGALGWPGCSMDAPRRLRENWMAQVEETVRQLHGQGIVWGDVKPDNVLIDRNDDAWVIDFGGGFNSRFVDRDMIETKQGDLQGLKRLREFLEV